MSSVSGVTEDTGLTIFALRSRRTTGHRYSGRLHDDWQLAEDRRSVVERVFAHREMQASVRLMDMRALPHERRLALHWRDGSSLQIRLDQGFGFWRTSRPMAFEFSSPVEEQMVQLGNMSFSVVRTPDQETTIGIGPITIVE